MKVLAIILSLASVTLALDNWSVIYAASDTLYGSKPVDADLKPILVDIINHLMQVSFSTPETQDAYLNVYPTLESFPENFVPTLNAALDSNTNPILTEVYFELLGNFMTLIFAVEESAVQPTVPIASPQLPELPTPIETPVAPVAPIVVPVEQPIAASKSPLVEIILNIRQN